MWLMRYIDPNVLSILPLKVILDQQTNTNFYPTKFSYVCLLVQSISKINFDYDLN